MKIVAKYRGTCAVCYTAIHVGQEIEWRRGYAPAHYSCATGGNAPRTSESEAAAPAEVLPEGARRFRAPLPRGYVPHAAGDVISADGAYWRVVSSKIHRINEAEDDTRVGEREEILVAVPATEAESASLRAQKARKDAEKDLAAIHERILRDFAVQDDPAQDGEIVWQQEQPGAAPATLTLTASGALVAYHPGHYDSWIRRWGLCADPDVVNHVRGLLGR